MKRFSGFALNLAACMALSFLALDASAACTPSVNASLSGTTLTINASVSGNCGFFTRLSVAIDGTPAVGATCFAATCNHSWLIDVSCFPTGTHTIQATGECLHTVMVNGNPSCEADTPGTASTSFSVYTKPDVSVSYSADTFGRGALSVPYNFPNTKPGSGQRHLNVTINGAQWTGTDPLTTSGEWTPGLDITCWTPGTVDLEVIATACGQWGDPDYTAEAHTTVEVTGKPSVSAQVDQAANTATFTYSYPNTLSSGQRDLHVFADDGLIASASFDQQSGTHGPLALPACWDTLRAVATACDQNGNPEFTDEAQTQGTHVKPTVSVSLLKLEPGFGSDIKTIQGTVTYDLKSSGGSVRVVRLPFVDADGQTHPEVQLLF